MKIDLATSDDEIRACYPVMRELRPQLREEEFLTRVRKLESGGYRLAAMANTQGAVAVAGFRIGESLAWGRYLYVDDLVTLTDQRSKGYGSALLNWLRIYGSKQGCRQLHLDSGMQRLEAHRFYIREGMTQTSLHFVQATE
jgi:GNAT superfamily N-acetyltransferase